MSEKAIVTAGSRKLICEVDEVSESTVHDTGVDSHSRRARPGDVIIAKKAWEFRHDMFLINTQQGPVTYPKISAIPLDMEDDEVDIEVQIDSIRWFSDMKDKGMKYDLLVEEIKDLIVQARAERAGITKASASQMPKNTPKDSGIIL